MLGGHGVQVKRDIDSYMNTRATQSEQEPFKLNIINFIAYITPTWLVSDIGGRYLETDPNFGFYRHFCGILINICNDRNPNRIGTQN